MDKYDEEINRLEKDLSEKDGIKNVHVELIDGENGSAFQVRYFDKIFSISNDFVVEREALDTYEDLLKYCEGMIDNGIDNKT